MQHVSGYILLLHPVLYSICDMYDVWMSSTIVGCQVPRLLPFLYVPNLCCPVLGPMWVIHPIIHTRSDQGYFNLVLQYMYTIRVQTDRFSLPVAIFYIHRGTDPYTVVLRFQVWCERPGGRRVGPGPGWIGLFDRIGSAHTTIYVQKALSCPFLQRKPVSGCGVEVFGYCTS